MIISASRRTDIPGYFSEWFMKRLQAGYVLTRNPFNHAQISKTILSPGTIDGIVFWTKDPINMMNKLEELNALGYSYYFQFTLTPYGYHPDSKWIEPNLREKKEIIKTFQQLSIMLGEDRVLWRYDPILITRELTIDYHMDMFAMLCSKLEGYTKICTISFVDLYSKINKRVKPLGMQELTEKQMHDMAGALAKIAQNHGIEVRACCETIDLSTDGVKPAACIDKELVERICGHAITAKKDKNQRGECGCIQSVDIGVYNTCKNGCLYCYANHSEASIYNNCFKHNPNSDILIGVIGEDERINERPK